jgi:hypothetical protein
MQMVMTVALFIGKMELPELMVGHLNTAFISVLLVQLGYGMDGLSH